MNIEDVPPGLLDLLGRLRAWCVDWDHHWETGVSKEDGSTDKTKPGDYDDLSADREEGDLAEANVISSELLPTGPASSNPFESLGVETQHVAALDIDVPAYLIPSSTEGHSHLYIEVPGGIPWPKFKNLLDALADCGVIEEGYADVSKKRGHTNLRLPWVKKDSKASSA